MKIRNIRDIPFHFEETDIEPGATVEVDAMTGQRLLALYWHFSLDLVTDEAGDVAAEITEDTPIEDIEQDAVPGPKPEEPELEPVPEKKAPRGRKPKAK